MADTVQIVLQALETLAPFSYNTYQQNIKDILAVDVNNWSSPCYTQVYGEDPGGDSNVINRFKVETIALGVSRTSSYGFSGYVKGDLSNCLIDTAAKLVVPIYRQYLEDHIASTGQNLSILQLVKDPSFCQAFVARVLDPSFINDTLIARYFGQAQYTQAIAYIYERSRATLLSLPSNASAFDSVNNVQMPLSQVARTSLPGVNIFAATATSNTTLSKAAQTDSFLATAMPIQWSNNTLLQGPSFGTLGAIWSASWSADTYSTAVANNLIQKATYTTYSAPGPEPTIPATYVTYGDALFQWIQRQQSSGFSDVFFITGNENFSYVSPFGSCFTPETLIETSAGSIPINKLTTGIRVLVRAPDKFGTLSNEMVKHDTSPVFNRNVMRMVNLYGFNGEEPFVTGGHIFFTIAGPKAIVPSMAHEENPGIAVGKLREGDILLKLKADLSEYDRVKIYNITCSPAKCDAVYGIHFARSGSNVGRYHANGYWVAENYPELTIQSLRHRFAGLNPIDKKDFCNHVRSLPNTFRKIFGVSVFEVFQTSFSDPLLVVEPRPTSIGSAILHSIENVAKKHVSLPRLTANFRLIHSAKLKNNKHSLYGASPGHDLNVSRINGDTQLPTITIANGAVLVDGQLVKYASMSHMSVQWSHELQNRPGTFQHGALRVTGHGRAVTGFIGMGNSDATGLDQLSDIQPVFAMADVNDYSLSGSPTIFATIAAADVASPAQGTTWPAFWKITVGLQMKDGGYTVQLTIPDLDAEWQRQNSTTKDLPSLYLVAPASLDTTSFILTVPIKVTTGLESFLQQTLLQWGNKSVVAGPAFESIVVLLNLESNGVHGYYTELTENPPASGNYTDGPIHALYSESSTSLTTVHANTLAAISHGALAAVPARNSNVRDPTANIHLPALPITHELSQLFYSAADLSIADLQTTPAPDDSDMHLLAQTYMQNAARYWRLQPEIDVFGNDQDAVRTALPDSLTTDLDSTGQAFFGAYSRALIMQSLSTNSTYTSRFTENQQYTLSYYWQGSKKGCISQDTTFNQVSTIAASAAFLKYTPGLNAYIADSRDWALDFYNFLSTDTQLNNQALAMFVGGTNNLTNRYCMILRALDSQNRNFDVLLWKAVRNKLLLRPSMGTITDTSDEFPGFAEAFTQYLIVQIQSGTSSDLFTELGIDLQSLETAFETKDAATIAAEIFNATKQLGQCFAAAIASVGKIVSQGGVSKLSNLMTAFSEAVTTKAPRFVKVLPYLQSFCAIAVQGFSIYVSIKFLLNWNNLSPEDRANAIISVVSATVSICRDVASLIQRIRGLDPKSFDYQIACVKWNNTTGPETPIVNQQEENSEGVTETTPLLQDDKIAQVNSEEEGSSIDEQMGKVVSDTDVADGMTKTFNLSEAVSGALSVAANIASAVCLGFQISADFQNGQPVGIKVMDILTEVTTCAQVITGALEIGFAVVGVECAALPIVGAVIALIGIVLMFVELFVPRQPPEDPVNKYIDNQQTGFFTPLPLPPPFLMTYTVTPATVTLKSSSIITISVTDPTNVGIALKSIIIKMDSSDSASALFSAPSGSDANGNPTTNMITYGIGGGRTDFKIAGAKFASASDNSIIAKVSSTDAANGAKIGTQGLTITIQGTVNSQAGKSQIKISEGSVSRPDGAAAGDVYGYFNVTKS